MRQPPTTAPTPSLVRWLSLLSLVMSSRPSSSAASAFAFASSSAPAGTNRWGPPLPPPASPATAAATARTRVHSTATTAENAISSTSASDASSDEVTKEDEPHLKTCDVLSLPSIRSTLIRQEETIIFALIERAQFRVNAVVYDKGPDGMGRNLGVPLGSVPPPEGTEEGDDEEEVLSFLEYMLVGTEVLHCGVRRYTSPEEHAFFPDRLPAGMLLDPLDYPQDLLSPVGGACDVNFNPILLRKYIEAIVPAIAPPGDDEQHGSTVLADTAVLQALSRRVHYGKFVAESKYRSDPEGYQKLIDAGDADGVMKLLTNTAVEEQVLRRARLKAATYGREPMLSSLPSLDDHPQTTDDNTAIIAAAAASAVVAAVEAMDERGKSRGKVDPAVIESVYRDIIIPMTKDIEVAYLFRRCGRDPPPEYAPDRMSIDCV